MTSPTSDPLSSSQRARLGIVRLAMLSGVLLFGAVIWFLQRDPARRPAPRPDLAILGTVSYGLAAVVIVGLFFVRQAALATRDAGRYSSLAVIGTAIAESVGLLGGVYWFLTGDPSRWAIGVMVTVLALVMIPLRRT